MADNRISPKDVSASAPAAAPVAAPSATELLLAQALARITELMEKQTEFNDFSKRNAPRRKKTMEQYLQENPRKRTLHQVFQNGREVNPSGLSKETLTRLDQLAPGIYADGLVGVIRVREGLNGLNTRIHLTYDKSTEASKMMFYMRFPSFTALVNGIWEEMKATGKAPVCDDVAEPLVDPVPASIDE